MKRDPSPESVILTLRQQRVILDADLAELYGVSTKQLNQQIKRNGNRFPSDFVFQLTQGELLDLKSQFVTSNTQVAENQYDGILRSQFATSRQGGRRSLPYAFTEHGALMAANVLNSAEAAKMSVYVVRAFIKQREILLAQSDVLKRLAQIDTKLLKHDEVLRVIVQELQPLLTPPPALPPPPPKPPIGFRAR